MAGSSFASATYRQKRREKLRRRAMSGVRGRAEKRLAAPPPDRREKPTPWYEWEITLKNKRDGASVTFDLKSVRDATRRIAVMVKHYCPRTATSRTLSTFSDKACH